MPTNTAPKSEKRIISIDRTKPFDPVQFICRVESFVFEGKRVSHQLSDTKRVIIEQDERALVITELDLNKICLKTMLKNNEISICGKERITRLKNAGHIRLDAKVFQVFCENPNIIPEQWKEKVNGSTSCIHFDGTVIRNRFDVHHTLFLFWDDYQWFWGIEYFDCKTYVGGPSVVCVSK
ncbi:MAG: hypothetical protein HQ536_02075 [Parcubacteria group bacterium]|nr:hypothetical protein [Parcubacteria group bacterium]